MNFTSDNAAGVSKEILSAIASCDQGYAEPYGMDSLTAKLKEAFTDVFETTDLDVFPVISGTAANALALASLCPPHGCIFCHKDAHIHTDECGAPEFFTHGSKLIPIDGGNGKIQISELENALKENDTGYVHQTKPSAISLSQTSEAGTNYTTDEILAISTLAKKHHCHVHMDGARFANALVNLECSPADMTWKSGIDILSFGATKNGAMAAEAVVVFNHAIAKDFLYRQKRAGHLVSKMRFISAQLEAYLQEGLWLKNAFHANELAQRMYKGLVANPDIEILYPVHANELFITIPNAVVTRLHHAGATFYDWPYEDKRCVRLVTSFKTLREEVDAFLKIANQ